MAFEKRNIILLSDGTGNSASSLFKTNVRRLYEALDLADPRKPRQPRQFAYYDDGVGTSSFRPLAILGGAFGFGLARNVRDLYAFLCRTYRPGDRIYAFGFSRGAFTVRVTVGLIVNQGILAYDGDEATLSRNVKAAFRAYRRERYGPFSLSAIWGAIREPVRSGDLKAAFRAFRKEKRNRFSLTTLWRAARDPVLRVWWNFRGYQPFEDVKRHRIGADGEGSIEFVGVWDTVDAYGLPIEELTKAVDTVVIPLAMPDADLAQEVRRARQALSLDDQRNTFHPRLWNEEKESDPNRIRQVWFAGAHADVGGGYPDDGLAHVTLRWMMNEAEAAVPGDGGLRFIEEFRQRHQALADENAPLHDSRRGLASYYRYKPRRLDALGDQPADLARRYKVKIHEPVVHESVLRRIKVGQDGYAPISLPPAFRVQLIDGGATEIQDGQPYVWGPDAAAGGSDRFPQQQEHVWNFVWWRRIAYFTTLGGTLFLLSLPLHMEVKACESWACFLSPSLLGAGTFLPGFASSWTHIFASNPATFLVGAGFVLLGTFAGRSLDIRVPDEMRRIWYGTRLRPQRPPSMATFSRPRGCSRLNREVERLRTSKGYRDFWNVMRRIVLPTLAFAVAIVLMLGGLNMALLSVREAWGGICGSDGLTTQGFPFRTSSVCHRVPDGELVAGADYTLRVTIPGATIPGAVAGSAALAEAGCRWAGEHETPEWRDGDMPATPNGIRHAEWWMPFFVPFRRHIGEPWHKLMVRVGKKGSDAYSPDWRLVTPAGGGSGDTYEARFRARRSGPLFVYVNDALPVVAPRAFYACNNRGIAEIGVTLLGRAGPNLP